MASRIRIRGGSGLGDALYVQSVARHLVEQGHYVEACSNFPELFRPLNGRCLASQFRRNEIDRVAHYSRRRHIPETDQFKDCCLQAGLMGQVDLRLDWVVERVELFERVRFAAWRKPIVLVQLPRHPMGREDGYADELLPDCRTIQRAIDAMGDSVFIVQVGKGEPLYRFTGIDLDLVDQTSPSDLMDVASAADVCLGYVSFMIPLAESLRRPALMVWSQKGLRSGRQIIQSLVPEKVIHRRDQVKVIMDDCSDLEMKQAVDALLEQVRSPALV